MTVRPKQLPSATRERPEMEKKTQAARDASHSGNNPADIALEQGMPAMRASQQLMQIPVDYLGAMTRYQSDFLLPFSKAVLYFQKAEAKKGLTAPLFRSFWDYYKLMELNAGIVHQATLSSAETIFDYYLPELDTALSFWHDTFSASGSGVDKALDYIDHQADTIQEVAHEYPEAIRDIADEFGFHFERGENSAKIAETDRFILYQIFPNKKDLDVRNNGKPILIVHPYVLGADILAFLPAEQKSYVHCFANQRIPTYVRILKNINNNPAVQQITLEDDIGDTRHFCEIIRKKHGRPVTLNGYCQGGLITLANILSGELDGLVDAHITCVAPIDGTRSEGLGGFLKNLPQRFNDLAYGTKTLSNGNQVADGDLMSWVYKLKSIREEYPLAAMYRDLAMLEHFRKKGAQLSKTILALNHWLYHQRHDLPMEITKLSFASYNTPITKEGVLPFKAFNRPLNMKRLAEKGIPMLICYGENDALVEKPCALAPLDYIDAEVAPFPKGHVAIATSWSQPASEYALHTRFGEGYRGPVRFQLDLEQEQTNSREKP